MDCKNCGHALSESIFKKNKTLKSCPKCSEMNGSYHVFHSNPQYFGITEKRASSRHPEGPQSYCVKCRGGNTPSGGILCKDIE